MTQTLADIRSRFETWQHWHSEPAETGPRDIAEHVDKLLTDMMAMIENQGPEGAPPPAPISYYDLVPKSTGADDPFWLAKETLRQLEKYRHDIDAIGGLGERAEQVIAELMTWCGVAKKFPCVPRDGEPSFLLLGRDGAFEGLIDIWCEARRMLIALGLKPKSDLAKIIEAHNIAEAGRQYRLNIEVDGRMRAAGLAPAPEDDDAAGGE